MRRHAILAAAGAAVAASSGWAAAQTLNGSARQSVEVAGEDDSGLFDGPTLRSTTSLSLNYSYDSPRTSVRFSPGVSYIVSSQDGAGFESINDFSPSLAADVSRRAGRWNFGASLSVAPRLADRDVSLDDFFVIGAPPLAPPGEGDPENPGGDLPDQPDIPDLPPTDDLDDPSAPTPSDRDGGENDAVLLDVNAALRASYRADPRTTLSAAFSTAQRRFIDSGAGFEDTASYGPSMTVRRRLNSTTSFNASLGARVFDNDDGSSSTIDFGAGVSQRINPRVNYSLNLGASLVQPDVFSGEPEVRFTGGGNASLSLPGGSLSVGFAQSVDQSDEGDVQTSTSVFTSFSRRLTPRASFSLPLVLTSQDAVFVPDPTNFDVSVGPSLSYRLYDDVGLSLSYRLRFRQDDESDPFDGGIALVTLTYGFAIRP